MKFDFGLEGSWSQKNKEYLDSTHINPLSSIRTFPGITIALSEIVRGLVRLFPHRKSFGVIKGCGPFYEDIVEYLSMDGLLRTDLEVGDLKNPDECLSKIPKDCLFVLGSYDDPMTGEVFPIEGLYPGLHKIRCFTICTSHSYHLTRQLPTISQYMAVIAKIQGQGAIALLGQRASKVPPLYVGPTDWFSPQNWRRSFEHIEETKKEILEFERKLPSAFVPFFDQDANRLYDRAVIRALEFDGEACIQLLAQELGLKLQEAGMDNNFETLSLCRWQSLNTFNWYTHQKRNPSDLRGVFMLDQNLINPKTTAALSRISETLKTLQS